VQIGVRQQSQVTSTLDGACQLTLILGAGTGDTARYDLARFSDVVFQSNDIFVVDLGNVLGGEAAELYDDGNNVPWPLSSNAVI
jgi:hypothetical protein